MFWKIVGHTFLFILLTLLSQVGGILWLLAAALRRLFASKLGFPFSRLLLFLTLHLFATLSLIPPLAQTMGRVPLPLNAEPALRPESAFFWFLNRNYVKPELKTVLEDVAQKLRKKYPGTTLRYLDACFPFIDGYPLEPHFSHRDGKKVDIAFFWLDARSEQPVNGTPSPFGYGVCEKPLPGEYDYNKICREKGYWYTSLDMQMAEPFFEARDYLYDQERNREMIRLFAEHPAVGKIFIEPHLKTRLGLEAYGKLRRQGCRAARHDDHIHVQL